MGPQKPNVRPRSLSCAFREPSTSRNAVKLSALVLLTNSASSTACRVLSSLLSHSCCNSISLCVRPLGHAGGSVPSPTHSSSSCTMKPEDISSDATQAVRPSLILPFCFFWGPLKRLCYTFVPLLSVFGGGRRRMRRIISFWPNEKSDSEKKTNHASPILLFLYSQFVL